MTLAKQTKLVIDRLFWKIERADAVIWTGSTEKRVPIASLFHALGEIDLTLTGVAIDQSVDDIWFFGPDQVTTPEICWPIDKTNASITSGDGWPDETLQIIRLHTIGLKEARALGASRFSPFMLEYRICWILPDGKAYTQSAPWGWIGRKFCELRATHSYAAAASDGNRRMRPQSKAEALQTDDVAKLAISQSLRDRYERKAIIRSDNGLAVALSMNADTAQSFFKLREVPDGQRRRSALRNWVTEHLRVIGDDKTTTVREHLRNRVQFEWAGFQCEYRPSAYDEERNDSIRDAKDKKGLGSARA